MLIFLIYRRHLLETEGREQLLASCGSPDLIEAAGIVVTVQDVNSKGAFTVEPVDKEGSAQAAEGQPNYNDGTYMYVSILARAYETVYRISSIRRRPRIDAAFE